MPKDESMAGSSTSKTCGVLAQENIQTRGADRWGMTEIKLLTLQAVKDLVASLKCVEAMGERRPITLVLQVYWSAACRADVLARRQLCKARVRRLLGKVPLRMLVEFAIESGYPLYALDVALNMYGQRRRHSHLSRLVVGMLLTCCEEVHGSHGAHQ
eukprot:3967900-Amphidinium_carterae.1